MYQHYADNRFLDRGGSIAGNHLVSARDPQRGTRLFATNLDGQVVTNAFGKLEWASLKPEDRSFSGRRVRRGLEGSDVVIRAADGYVYRSRQVGSTEEFSPWVRVGESRYGSGAAIVKLWNGEAGILFTDQVGATHL